MNQSLEANGNYKLTWSGVSSPELEKVFAMVESYRKMSVLV